MGMVDEDEQHYGHPKFDTPCSRCGSLIHVFTNTHVNGRALCGPCSIHLAERPPESTAEVAPPSSLARVVRSIANLLRGEPR